MPTTDNSTLTAAEMLERAGYHALLGYQKVAWTHDMTEIILPLAPHHLNLGGVVHGGVLASLLDICCAQSGTFCEDPYRIKKAITLSLTTTFTGQATSGTLRAIGKVKARGSRIYNATGEVFDDKGNLLAFGEGTFRLRSSSVGSDGEPLHSLNI